MPPPPKNPATRQRTNKSSTHAVLEKALRFPAPELPKGEWHERTRAFWAKVWKSEMAGEFVEADVEQVYILATLVEDFWRGDHSVAAEIRLQGQRFGLSPLDRRRLDWTLAEQKPPEPVVNTPRPVNDPRKVLEMKRK